MFQRDGPDALHVIEDGELAVENDVNVPDEMI